MTALSFPMRLKSAVNQQEKEAGCFPIFLKAYYNGTAKAFRDGWVKKYGASIPEPIRQMTKK